MSLHRSHTLDEEPLNFKIGDANASAAEHHVKMTGAPPPPSSTVKISPDNPPQDGCKLLRPQYGSRRELLKAMHWPMDAKGQHAFIHHEIL